MPVNNDRIIDRFLEVQSNEEIFDDDRDVPQKELWPYLADALREFIKLLDFETKLHKIARDVSKSASKVEEED